MQELNLDHIHFAALSSEILKGGNSFAFQAQGNSMRPFVLTEDILTVEPVSVISLRFGDILFCRTAESRIVVHRLMGWSNSRDGEKFLIKGDDTNEAAEQVSEEQVLGRVIQIRRGDRLINQRSVFLRTLIFLWVKTYPLSSFLYYLPGRVLRRCIRFFKNS